MKQILALASLDVLRVKNWFRTSAATKILVIVGFIAVLGVVILVEFALANVFFRLTSTQEEFGKAVAQYSINAAMLVLFLLASVSSLAASNAVLFKPKFLRFLHTTPLSTMKLFISRSLSSLVSSLWILVFLLTPILIAFGLNFSQGGDFILRSLFVIILLSLSSQALGSILALTFTRIFGRVSRIILTTMFALVIGGSLGLVRFLFPPKFYSLYNAPDWLTFQSQLGQLPLLSSKLPTNWLADTITNSWSPASLTALIATVILIVVALYIGKKTYLLSWRSVQEGHFVAGSLTTKSTRKTSFPNFFKSPKGALLENELLAILRSPSEIGYIAFLSGLTIILLFMTRNTQAIEKAAPTFVPAVQALTFAGLSYLFMTLTARLVYPLMAREKRTSWFLFSAPIRREEIVWAKSVFALLITVPAAIIGLIAGNFLGFPVQLTIIFTTILLVTAGFVSLLQLFFGIISPNFAEADNLEAASTSGSGLAAVVLSLSFIFLAALIFYFVIIGALPGLLAAIFVIIISLLLVVPLALVARHSIYSYNL